MLRLECSNRTIINGGDLPDSNVHGWRGIRHSMFIERTPIKGVGRPKRLLPHAKILLVAITFFPLLGRLYSERFYIFTEQM